MFQLSDLGVNTFTVVSLATILVGFAGLVFWVRRETRKCIEYCRDSYNSGEFNEYEVYKNKIFYDQTCDTIIPSSLTPDVVHNAIEKNFQCKSNVIEPAKSKDVQKSLKITNQSYVGLVGDAIKKIESDFSNSTI
jgi:hypothetical protein